MISVNEAATILSVTPTRVRKLIADGHLAAEKIGREWVLNELDVIQRLSEKPKAGRPSNTPTVEPATDNEEQKYLAQSRQAHKLFLDCKDAFQTIPDHHLIANAVSAEEASFYIAISDFFLQQKQRKLVEQGIY